MGSMLCPKLFRPPLETSSLKLRTDSQGGTFLPEVWLPLLWVDHAKMSAEDGLGVCSVALIWARD